jgi:hypothetical protein
MRSIWAFVIRCCCVSSFSLFLDLLLNEYLCVINCVIIARIDFRYDSHYYLEIETLSISVSDSCILFFLA